MELFPRFLVLFLKDKEFAENVVENDNKHLSDKGLNGVDHFDIMINKLADNLREASHKDKGQE